MSADSDAGAMLREVAAAMTRSSEAMARAHFAATPIYLETVLATGILPARLAIVHGPTYFDPAPGVYRVTGSHALVEVP